MEGHGTACKDMEGGAKKKDEQSGRTSIIRHKMTRVRNLSLHTTYLDRDGLLPGVALWAP